VRAGFQSVPALELQDKNPTSFSAAAAAADGPKKD